MFVFRDGSHRDAKHLAGEFWDIHSESFYSCQGSGQNLQHTVHLSFAIKNELK